MTQKRRYIPHLFKGLCKSFTADTALPAFFQMLRVQRVYGKSRIGASVPLCVKLQGRVLCENSYSHNNKYDCSSTNEEPKQSTTPLMSAVCKRTALNFKCCDQPQCQDCKGQSSGRFLVYVIKLSSRLLAGSVV